MGPVCAVWRNSTREKQVTECYWSKKQQQQQQPPSRQNKLLKPLYRQGAGNSNSLFVLVNNHMLVTVERDDGSGRRDDGDLRIRNERLLGQGGLQLGDFAS